MTPTIKAKETFGHIKSLFSFITNKSVSHQIANILDDTLNLQI